MDNKQNSGTPAPDDPLNEEAIRLAKETLEILAKRQKLRELIAEKIRREKAKGFPQDLAEMPFVKIPPLDGADESQIDWDAPLESIVSNNEIEDVETALKKARIINAMNECLDAVRDLTEDSRSGHDYSD